MLISEENFFLDNKIFALESTKREKGTVVKIMYLKNINKI